MTTPRPRESQPPESREAISADADDWIRQFIKHLEYVTRILDRDEFRRHCDRFRTRSAVLANLR